MPLPSEQSLIAAVENMAEDMQVLGHVTNDGPGTTTTRLGQVVPTLQQRLLEVGFKPPVAFASGLSVTSSAYTVVYLNNTYHANPSVVPFTTTSTFNASQWLLVPTAQVFSSIVSAAGAPIPTSQTEVWVGGVKYTKWGTTNPAHSRSFLSVNGFYYSAVQLPTTGPLELHAAIFQSEGLGISGGATNEGGRRQAADGVVVMEKFPVDKGLVAAGPGDEGWVFRADISSVVANSAPYQYAAMRAAETGGLVVLAMFGVGGQPIAEFLPGGYGGFGGATGSIWLGFQNTLSSALSAQLPGRAGSLMGYGVSYASVLHFWQGSGDADASTNAAKATGPQWRTMFKTFLTSCFEGAGSSAAFLHPDISKVFVYECLYGATAGGAPGVGYATDSRNPDIRAVVNDSSNPYTKHCQLVSMANINRPISFGDVIGSADNLHPSGGALEEVARRAFTLPATTPRFLTYSEMLSGFHVTRLSPNTAIFTRSFSISGSGDVTYTLPAPIEFSNLLAPIGLVNRPGGSSVASADVQVTGFTSSTITLTNKSTYGAVGYLTIGPVILQV